MESVHDIGAFTQTLVLSATAQGLASITAYELVKFPTLVKEIMEISSSETLAGLLVNAYPTYLDLKQDILAGRDHLG